MQIAYSPHKSYVDHRIRDLEIEEGDKVYLKTLPMKGHVGFCKKWKWIPCYLGPY